MCGRDGNWACRVKCTCGREAPHKVRAKALESHKRAEGAAEKKGTANSPKNSASHDKLQRQLDESKRQHAQELNKVKAELEALRKANAGTTEQPEPDGNHMDVDPEGELGKAVARARARLQKVKDMPEEVRDLVAGGYAECFAKLQDELATAQAARRTANPLKQQLEGAEA